MAINLNHGNRLRPPEKAYERNKQRSRENYAKAMLAINPYWLNEKIIREEVNLNGRMCIIHHLQLIEKGLKPKLYSAQRTIEGEQVFIMKNHGYSLTTDKNFKLWKI
jgi:hypothetical protein